MTVNQYFVRFNFIFFCFTITFSATKMNLKNINIMFTVYSMYQ